MFQRAPTPITTLRVYAAGSCPDRTLAIAGAPEPGWAAFGRRFSTAYQTTNMPLERMHHTIKYTIMGGVINRRPGVLLDALFGAPANLRLISQSLVAFFGRRLQEARDTRYRGRRREMEKRFQSELGVLIAAYQEDESICTRSDPGLNLWKVQDGEAVYNVVQDAQTCTCAYSKSHEWCAHLLLIDRIVNAERNDQPTAEVHMDFTVATATAPLDRERLRQMMKQEVTAALPELQVRMHLALISDTAACECLADLIEFVSYEGC